MSENRKNQPLSVAEWNASKINSPEALITARKILLQVADGADVFETLRKNPIPHGGKVSKQTLVALYRQMTADGELKADENLLARIRMKPVRSLSGVTTVTVLTKPYPCTGECIFCPTDDRLPKSYIIDEPGAARAFQNDFDPYAQVSSRIKAYEAVGHPTEKIELLILGGSWINYPSDYREWFVQRCLDAMNEAADSPNLENAQSMNETAKHRCVGLVVETRPDEITPTAMKHLRYLGVTKVQLGIQSLNDRILTLNRRGHTVADALAAVALLRAAGFKIVLHWMPNLLGADPQGDIQDFKQFWKSADENGGFCPDELKIYPTQLVESAELYQIWKQGAYQPYDTETLINLIAEIKVTVPPYCRINRIVRDIPSHHIAAGNLRSSLRMDVQKKMRQDGLVCHCIRCREIRGQAVVLDSLRLEIVCYHAAFAQEYFLQFVTEDDKLVGYLRLSLPDSQSPDTEIDELIGAAMIREIHIYGQSLAVGMEQSGAAQHAGLGTALIEKAYEISRIQGYRVLAVITAIGTRRYYLSRGFQRGKYYFLRNID